MLGFLGLVLVLPLVRIRFRTGQSGFAFRTDSDPVHRLTGLALGAGLAAAIGWTLAYLLFGPEPLGIWTAAPGAALAAWLGLLAATSGLLLIMIAQAQMGRSWRIGIDRTPTALVTGGLYRFVRHPIYCGILASTVGLVLILPSAWSLMAGLQIALLIAIQSRLEERHLLAVHGAAFGEYAERSGRFIPLIGRIPREPGD
jgi:protein-S-isoprenylcysteine O-methyltransferase Ste14